MPYFEIESTFEGSNAMGEGCSPIDECGSQDLQLNDNLCDTPTCFERTLFPRLEFIFSCHETNDIEDMESLKYHF